jgi:hypothetical protein
MKRSPLPPPTTELARIIPLRSGQPLQRRQGLRAVGFTVRIYDGGATERVTPLKPRPKDTIPKKIRTIVNGRDYGLCVRCSGWAEHQHHRRLKGMGGSVAPHANCACVLVSLCHRCHDWAHANREKAEAEGLIIPRATLQPYLLPVLVHGPGSVSKALPTCDGRWLSYEPSGDGAA